MSNRQPNGDWVENRKYVLESLRQNAQDHASILVKLNEIHDEVIGSTKEFMKSCAESQTVIKFELKSLDNRVMEIEKLVENFKGRMIVTVSIIAVVITFLPHLLSWILTTFHIHPTPIP